MGALGNLLLTGGTGFVGFKILLDALKEGYNVRITYRSLQKVKNQIETNPKVKALIKDDNLTYCEVPDICEAGAFDKALENITHIIHCASPLPRPPATDPKRDIIRPALDGTLSLVNSALKVPSVKRIVVTSSIVSNMPTQTIPGHITKAESRTSIDIETYPVEDLSTGYQVSKILALNALDEFVETNKPSFDIINIMPGFIYGRNEMAMDIPSLFASANRLLLNNLTGQPSAPRLAGAVHIDDVARVHVKALDKEKVKTQDFGATISVELGEAFEIVRKHFPNAVEKGIFKEAEQATIPVLWDATKTEREFGFQFKTWEMMVVDLVEQYLELLGEEKA